MRHEWAKEVSSDAGIAAAIEDSGHAGEAALGKDWGNVDLVVNADTAALLEAHRPAYAELLKAAERLIVDARKGPGAFWEDRRIRS